LAVVFGRRDSFVYGLYHMKLGTKLACIESQ